MNGTKDYWKHTENGRVYAIKCTCFGQILGACGPLDEDNLPDLDEIDYSSDILIWVESPMTEGKLRRVTLESLKDKSSAQTNPIQPMPGSKR